MLKLIPSTRGGYEAIIDELTFWVRDLALGLELARTLDLAAVVLVGGYEVAA